MTADSAKQHGPALAKAYAHCLKPGNAAIRFDDIGRHAGPNVHVAPCLAHLDAFDDVRWSTETWLLLHNSGHPWAAIVLLICCTPCQALHAGHSCLDRVCMRRARMDSHLSNHLHAHLSKV